MKKVIAVVLPLLILCAASFAQDDDSADSDASASDFLKELSASAEPEPKPEPPAPEPVAEAGDEEEDDADAESEAAVKPPKPTAGGDQWADQQLRKKIIFRYTAIGLDVLGAGMFAYGIYENSNVTKYTKQYTKGGKEKYYKDIPAAESSVTKRNVAYILGSAFLAAGITIHIFF